MAPHIPSGALAAEQSADPRRAVLGRVLKLLGLLLFPATILTVATSRSVGLSVVGFGGAILAVLLGLRLLRQGYLSAVGWVFSIICLLIATGLTVALGGIGHNFVLLFPLGILFARLAIGRRAGLAFGLTSLAIGALATWLETTGRLRTQAPEQSALDEFMSFAALLGFLIALGDQSFGVLEDLLRREREARERLQLSAARRGLLARLGQRAVGTPDAQSFAAGLMTELATTLAAPAMLIAQLNNRALTPLAFHGIDAEAAARVALNSIRPLLTVAEAMGSDGSPSALVLPDLSPLPALVTRVDGPDGCLGLIVVGLGRQSSVEEDDFLATVAGLLATVFERDRQRSQMLRAEKLGAARQLAGSIAHQVNNVLTSVVAAADGIEQLTEGEPRRLATEIRQQARASARLTWHLLNLSQREVLRPEALDLAVVLHEVLTEVSPGLPPLLQIEEQLAPGLVATFDRAELAELFLCLIDNAREATGTQGRVMVTLAPLSATSLVLEISDFGTGMSPVVLGRAGDPFFTTWPGHAGLGLSTVRLIAERRGGTMAIRSELGRGTTVRIEMPRTEAKVPLAVVPPVPLPGSTARGILIVDDNDALRRALARTLRVATGHPIFEASDGRQALLRLDSGDLPAAVITDILMPIVGGIAVAKRARELGLPVLLMSGYADDKAEEVAQFDFLAKPMEPSDLIDWVERVLPPASAAVPEASTSPH